MVAATTVAMANGTDTMTAGAKVVAMVIAMPVAMMVAMLVAMSVATYLWMQQFRCYGSCSCWVGWALGARGYTTSGSNWTGITGHSWGEKNLEHTDKGKGKGGA